MTQTRTVLLHCHIFKNGGSTIDCILKNNFGNDSISIESPDGTFIRPQTICEIAAQTLSIKSISSHKLGTPPPEHPDITFIPLVMLREPLDRLKSIYLYYRRQEQPISQECLLAQRTSFKEFVATLIEANLANSFTNLQSRFFLAQPAESSRHNWPKIIHQAAETRCLGVLDRFSESLSTWEKHLNQYHPDFDFNYLKQNISPNRPDSLKDRLLEIKEDLGKQLVNNFIKLNTYDYQLYEYAKERITYGKDMLLPGNSTYYTKPTGKKPQKAIQDKTKIEMHNIRMVDTATTNLIRIVQPGQEVTIETSIRSDSTFARPIIGFTVKNSNKEIVFEVNNLQAKVTLSAITANSNNLYKFRFTMPPLTHGIYSITLAFADGTQYDHVLYCQQVDAIVFVLPKTSGVYLQGVINIPDVNITCLQD